MVTFCFNPGGVGQKYRWPRYDFFKPLRKNARDVAPGQSHLSTQAIRVRQVHRTKEHCLLPKIVLMIAPSVDISQNVNVHHITIAAPNSAFAGMKAQLFSQPALSMTAKQ
ncbi:hypothetical protein [Roseovarius sp. THAF8]|uniref:hypothetical protein n=1 Tax=Roseovarius sp. THAF8 TaxID=2587846 RepID=UPI0012696F2B|nr:hypothetical protein [Roseovarius sp. THAF8]